MFRRQLRSEDSKDAASDTRLTTLLHQWKDVSPKADFDETVWRRIHLASAPEERRFSIVTILHEWVVSPSAWVNAMAAAAGIIVAVGLALGAPAARVGRQSGEPLLYPQTVTGSYLVMVTGETR